MQYPDSFSMNTPTTPQQKPPKKRALAVALIALAVLIIACSALLIFRPKNCFDAEDYTDLVALAQNFENGEGAALYNVLPNQELFTQSVYFLNDTTEVNAEFTDDTASFFQKLGAYYKDRQETAPISITLESNYLTINSPETATQRLQVVKDNLVKAGISEPSITVKEPMAVELDEDSAYEDDVIDGMPVGIRITPIPRCET